MIREKVGLLSKPFRDARSEFNNKITGVKDSEDRWRTCTSITNDNMGVPIGSLYIRKYFDDSRVNTVSEHFFHRMTNVLCCLVCSGISLSYISSLHLN